MKRTLIPIPPGRAPPQRKPSYEERIDAWLAKRPTGSGPPTAFEMMAVLRDPPKKPVHVPGLPQPEPPPAKPSIREAMGSVPIGTR